MKFPQAYENKLRAAYNHLDSAYATLEEVAMDMQDSEAFTNPTLTQEDVEEAQQELEEIRDSAEQARDNLEILAALNPMHRD